MGITRPGTPYRFRTVTQTGVDGRLVVKLPAQWSERAAAAFRRANGDATYGVGVRASTDLAKLRDSFDVAGARITVTAEVPKPFDGVGVVHANAFDGCHAGPMQDFDNGRYAGKAQVFSRCSGKATGAIVVAAVDETRAVFLVLAAQVRTKADLVAIDRALASARFAATSLVDSASSVSCRWPDVHAARPPRG